MTARGWHAEAARRPPVSALLGAGWTPWSVAAGLPEEDRVFESAAGLSGDRQRRGGGGGGGCARPDKGDCTWMLPSDTPPGPLWACAGGAAEICGVGPTQRCTNRGELRAAATEALSAAIAGTGLRDIHRAENLQSRITGMLLMAQSNSSERCSLDHRNKSMARVGYPRCYGDISRAGTTRSRTLKPRLRKI